MKKNVFGLLVLAFSLGPTAYCATNDWEIDSAHSSATL